MIAKYVRDNREQQQFGKGKSLVKIQIDFQPRVYSRQYDCLTCDWQISYKLHRFQSPWVCCLIPVGRLRLSCQFNEVSAQKKEEKGKLEGSPYFSGADDQIFFDDFTSFCS